MFEIDTKTLTPEPEIDLVDKTEVENTLEAAQAALSMSTNVGEQDEPDPQFLPAGTPRRAPSQGRDQISPSGVTRTDGLVEVGELEDQLETRTRAILNTSAEVRIDFDLDTGPAIISYEFDEPIREITNGVGRFYSIYSENRKIPFQEGQSVERLVQVVSASAFQGELPLVERDATLTISADKAVWTLEDESDS